MNTEDKLKHELALSDDNVYYSDSQFVSNSMLSLLNKSPQHLERMLKGHKEESPALNFGKAFHTVVLEPEKVNTEIAVFEGKARRGKAWDEFKSDNESNTIITEPEYNKILKMRSTLCTPEQSYEFIENSIHEVVNVWEMLGVNCKGKVDCVYESDNGKILIDVKTTQDSSPEAFKRSAYKYGYHRQAAFYMDGMGADEFWFAVVEKEAPYRAGLYKASDEFLNNGRREIGDLLDKYRKYFVDKSKDINEYYFKGEL
jgi:exodeoxyribonuclease VIII